MRQVERKDILDLKTYETQRDGFRKKIMNVKNERRIHLGKHLTFLFENTETILYQIQEMIRIENIQNEKEILHEIKTYNELLGDHDHLGCTLLIEIEDEKERAVLLKKWLNLTEYLFVKLEDGSSTKAIFDSRQIGETRLSSVQYIKFKTNGQKPVGFYCTHPYYTESITLSEQQQKILSEDLECCLS